MCILPFNNIDRDMCQYLSIHPDNPQQRLIDRAVEIIRQGGVIAYPTDSTYALACHLGDKAALERCRKIRQLDNKHHFTLMCRDLSILGAYAQVSNRAYRLLRALTPNPVTFILRATREVPRRLQHAKRKTIGLRVPDHTIVRALLETYQDPLMTTTLLLPGDELPLNDAGTIYSKLNQQLDCVIDGGNCGFELTTVIDLVEHEPTVLRQGKVDVSEYISVNRP